jgi:hypothetical protein
MKKFTTLFLTLLVASSAWAVSADHLGSAIEKSDTPLFWAELEINNLKAMGLDIPEELYRAVREYYGLPMYSEPAARQGGDTVAEATVIDALPYSSTGTTVGFTDDYDEVCDYEGSLSPDVVYSYTPAEDITLDITLCDASDYDTKLYIYENEVTPGAPYACNDDECPGYLSELMGLDYFGGNTYYIVVDGYGSDEGNYTLDIEEDVYVEPDEGDGCVEPLIVDSLPYEFNGTTADNTDTYGNAAPDEWHLVTIYESGPYMFTLCGGGTDYDSYIQLLDGDCVTEIASNDDACSLVSEMEVTLDPGEYVLGVDGYSSYSGNYQLEIYAEEPPEYSNCQYPPHTPDEGWSAGTSHNNGVDVDYLRADRFADAGVITGLTVAGLRLIFDGAWATCDEDPMTFDVIFYEDGATPGAEVCSYMGIEASPVATGDLYAGYPLFEMTFELPTSCDMPAGWVGLQSNGACWFLWMSTGSGADGASLVDTDGAGWAAYDFDMTWCLSFEPSAVTDIDTPATVVLNANHPNPFNPETTISYELTAPQQVELVVFNVTGEKVATLVSGTQSAGIYSQQFDGSDLPSGIYFYRLNAGEFSQTNRMLLVK